MNEVIQAFPLQWPTGWPRSRGRKEAAFHKNKKPLSVYEGVMRVREELDRMGVNENNVVVSTNVALRLDGWPRSDLGNPSDPGAACYWKTRKGETKVMAIDRYTRVADNLAAIAATLDAMRAIERHGGAQILDRAFTGFTALPAPSKRQWWEELGCDPDSPTELVRGNYRALRSANHPDRVGDSGHALMAAINVAWDDFCKERGLESHHE